jgi:hypothetical protein
MKHFEFIGTLAAKEGMEMLTSRIPTCRFTVNLYAGCQEVETVFQIFGDRCRFLESLAINTIVKVTCVLPKGVKLTRKGLPPSLQPVLAWRIDADSTKSMKSIKIIDGLNKDTLERIAASLFPQAMREMLLHAPFVLKKQIIGDLLEKGIIKMKRELSS